MMQDDWLLRQQPCSALGSMQAGDAVTASPEVRAVALPHTGARLVIASDGLWDSVQAKTAVHHVRSMVANKAAHELVSWARLYAEHLRWHSSAASLIICTAVADALLESMSEHLPMAAAWSV